jgi:hypothetical protein
VTGGLDLFQLGLGMEDVGLHRPTMARTLEDTPSPGIP